MRHCAKGLSPGTALTEGRVRSKPRRHPFTFRERGVVRGENTMAEDLPFEGLQDSGEDSRGVRHGGSEGWSSRWSGQPDARSIRLPRVARRPVAGLAATIAD